jgi:hypothetical protein
MRRRLFTDKEAVGMEFNIRHFNKMLDENNIYVSYSGPIWANGVDGIAEMILNRFEYDDIPFSASQSIFSIFVEQINNMMMYSAEKEQRKTSEGRVTNVSRGVFILGIKDSSYFIQTGNWVTEYSAEILKIRIDHLNTLDKKEMRRFYKQQMQAENENMESCGAGIGLIEIARRATGPIEYSFEPQAEGIKYFTLSANIGVRGEA